MALIARTDPSGLLAIRHLTILESRVKMSSAIIWKLSWLNLASTIGKVLVNHAGDRYLARMNPRIRFTNPISERYERSISGPDQESLTFDTVDISAANNSKQISVKTKAKLA